MNVKLSPKTNRLTAYFLDDSSEYIYIENALPAGIYKSWEEIIHPLNDAIKKIGYDYGWPPKSLYFEKKGEERSLMVKPIKYERKDPTSSLGQAVETFHYPIFDPEAVENYRLFSILGLNLGNFRSQKLYIDEENQSPRYEIPLKLHPRPKPGPPLNSYLLCIYSSIVQHSYFGNSSTQLLRSFPLPHSNDFHFQIPFPVYLPAAKKRLDSIDIELFNENGESLLASGGTIELVLHFIKKIN